MRHLLTFAFALVAAPAAAEGTYLQSTTLECAALEASVFYGLIDGSQESTASALTDLMGLDRGPACLAELESYGYDAWVEEEDCVQAVQLIREEGARRRSGLSEQEVVGYVLSASDDDLCERMADRLDDYDDEDEEDGGSDGDSGSGGGSEGGITG